MLRSALWPASISNFAPAVNRDLGTTTVVITHNAAIKDIAHRVIYFADGRISRIVENERQAAPSDISW
jgi:putative ABC transport system ATP-binding protein